MPFQSRDNLLTGYVPQHDPTQLGLSEARAVWRKGDTSNPACLIKEISDLLLLNDIIDSYYIVVSCCQLPTIAGERQGPQSIRVIGERDRFATADHIP